MTELRRKLETLSKEFDKATPEKGKTGDKRLQRKLIADKEQLLYGKVRCFACGGAIEWEEATREHIVPRCYGGSNRLLNLALSHGECNWKRHDEFTKRAR